MEAGEGEVKVENLETGRRAQVRGDEWVSRRTAGRDIVGLSEAGEKMLSNNYSRQQRKRKDGRRGGGKIKEPVKRKKGRGGEKINRSKGEEKRKKKAERGSCQVDFIAEAGRLVSAVLYSQHITAVQQ